MPTINGSACVVDGKPVDKVFSNGVQVYGRNLYVVNTQVPGWWSNKDELNVASNSSAGDFIAVNPFKKYLLQMWNDNAAHDKWVGVNAYDGNKKFLNYTSYGTIKDNYRIATDIVQAMPTGTEFVRISYYSWNGETKIKFEEGTIPTAWSPAPEDVM